MMIDGRVHRGITHGEHVCGIFNGDGERDQAVTAFVAAGLADRDRVWCLTELTSPEAVLGSLRRAGVDVAGALDDGQLVVRSAAEGYLGEAPFDPGRMIASLRVVVEQAVADGYRGFRLSGDLAWATRGHCGRDSLMAYEERLGELFAGRPAAALCHYDSGRFDAPALEAAIAVHPRTLAGNDLVITPLASPVGLRLEGDIDLCSWEALQRALASVPATDGDVHLDLAALEFIDLGGTRALVGLAQRLAPARRLVIHDPPAMLERIIHAGWGYVAGLEVSR